VSVLLQRLGHEVLVANPRAVRLIYSGRTKDDELDAEALARLGRFDERLLHPVKHRSAEHQADLAVIRARDALVKVRTKLINQVRGVLKSFGTAPPKMSSESFHRQVRDLVPDELLPALGPLLDVLEQVTTRIADYDRTVENTAVTSYPETARLRKVSGVGTLTALAFVLTLEDPRRFANGRKVGSYLGLCPERAQSGEYDPQLGITKAGNPELRRLLVNCAHYIIGPFGADSDLRRFGQRLAGAGGKRARMRAAVAVARKLSAVLYRLWVSEESEYVALGYRRAA
jgi:transposase